MLAFLRDRASDRKLRLFAVACCRRIWHLLTELPSRKVILTTELYADGLADFASLCVAIAEADSAYLSIPNRTGYYPRPDQPFEEGRFDGIAFALSTAFAVEGIARSCAEENGNSDETTAQARLLQDIFGNPFHPLSPPSESVLCWNDGTVPKIAAGIYEERAFDRLPILADALLDAGCDDEELLVHCRSEGPHVRGCYLIDSLLGKEILRGGVA
jgi:hypothetical protein